MKSQSRPGNSSQANAYPASAPIRIGRIVPPTAISAVVPIACGIPVLCQRFEEADRRDEPERADEDEDQVDRGLADDAQNLRRRAFLDHRGLRLCCYGGDVRPLS